MQVVGQPCTAMDNLPTLRRNCTATYCFGIIRHVLGAPAGDAPAHQREGDQLGRHEARDHPGPGRLRLRCAQQQQQQQQQPCACPPLIKQEGHVVEEGQPRAQEAGLGLKRAGRGLNIETSEPPGLERGEVGPKLEIVDGAPLVCRTCNRVSRRWKALRKP